MPQATTANEFSFFLNKFDSLRLRGKGFSVFNADEPLLNNFLSILKSQKLKFQLIKTTNLFADAHIIQRLAEKDGLLVFFQDLPFDEFKSSSATIADKIVFPCWFRRVPLVFFSIIDRSEYMSAQIESGEIHLKFDNITNALLADQIFFLQERSNYQFSHPSFLDLPPEKKMYTPIEELLRSALDDEGINYQPQVKLGRYIVDFLVEFGNEKIIVECDGRAYHESARDLERDKALTREGYPICRFSGSEIFTDPKACVEEIQQRALAIGRSPILLDDNLDASQLRALEVIDGPIRVLAPAGSGKTKTLVNRIFHLINQGISREKILALAFNTRAKEEMQNRLIARGVQNIEVRTFHALGYEIIREGLGWKFEGSGYRKTQRQVMNAAIRKHVKLPNIRNHDPLDAFLDALRKVKMELPPINMVGVEISEKLYPFKPIFNTYLEEQTKRNFFDFDDMIYLAVRILLKDRMLRRRYQEQFEYILVDEFQDLNKAQLLLLQILSLPQNNIFAVGDDDQMIYGWRGANVRNILDFSARYPISQTIVLETNYRSSKKIVRHSSWLISNNVDRVAKDIKPVATANLGAVDLISAPSIVEQAIKAAKWLLDHKKTNASKWEDYAFLFRYNAYQFPVAIALDAVGIPHTPVAGSHLFNTAAGKDIYAYLSVILYPSDATPQEYERILKKPNKYLTNELISHAKDWQSLTALVNRNDLRGWEIDNLQDFINGILLLRELSEAPNSTASSIMQTLLLEIDLRGHYKDQSLMAKELDEAGEEINAEIIAEMAQQFDTIRDFYQFIHNSIENDEVEIKPRIEGENREAEVYLSTIHRAKGNEFSYVVYFNLNAPPKKIEGEDIEEERRVAYVAATRPKEDLLVTCYHERASSFLSELLLNPALKKHTENQLDQDLKFVHAKYAVEVNKKNEMENHYTQQIEKLEAIGNSDAILTNKLFLGWISQLVRKAQSKFLLSRIEKTNQSLDLLLMKIQPLEEEMKGVEAEIRYRKFMERGTF